MIIIGEKINGAIPVVAKAIAERDAEFIRERAKAQIAAAQDEDYFEEPVPLYIDVCASTDPAVEVETLKWMIEEVESVIPDELENVAIAVDSPSAAVCAEAFKFCKRTGIVNSVSMEKDEQGRVKTDIVFPAIADTDWGCIALLCESGIPQSVEDRMAVFEKIMAKAKEYGIAPNRLYIDPLVEAAATNQAAFTLFSECCRRIKAQYPDIHITSGLSNISFGFPGFRKPLNMAFMALAMQAGMDSAIVDPTNKDMVGLMYATELLTEQDEDCMNYIAAHRQGLL
ncbi:MAG TPA: dihydropteroate synthase [Candidatus Avoscillospira avistercoris]|uniref:Dihydropteroate synthase n=1 Tax=Candidatus Avoscillospira avistercoris TaxID=2840707 RepID=A0A9D1FAV3_9FIRM|nr:dihydropteroate synthase [Candidatus Avoscillospira avistercoris]